MRHLIAQRVKDSKPVKIGGNLHLQLKKAHPVYALSAGMGLLKISDDERLERDKQEGEGMRRQKRIRPLKFNL